MRMHNLARLDRRLRCLTTVGLVLSWLLVIPARGIQFEDSAVLAVRMHAPNDLEGEAGNPPAPSPSDVLGQPSNATPAPAIEPAPAPALEPDPLGPVPDPGVGPTHPQMWCQSVPPCRRAVACPGNDDTRGPRWHAARQIPWQVLAHGEYIGPPRCAHVPEYQIRVDDRVRFVFGLTGEASAQPYEINIGDLLRIESVGSPKLDREVVVQPDGAVTLRLLGQVPASGLTLEAFRADLEHRYLQYVKEPGISVTPVKINTRVEELRMAVDERYGSGGQGLTVRVTPAGTLQLPAIGSVPVQGLTLHEIEREVEGRYAHRFHGLDITPILDERAPRYIYVLGEVRAPGRYELVGPTTVMQAIALAGSWNVGARLKHVVVFRRDDCWGLMATKLDIHNTLFGKTPCPADEIWLRASDVVLVPKSALLATDDWIHLVFTRGIYGVVPLNYSFSVSALTSL